MKSIYLHKPKLKLPKLKEVGGKGLSLIKLSEKQFNIPPFSILTVKFFDPWIQQIKSSNIWQKLLESQDEQLKNASKEVKQFSKSLSFSTNQKEALTILKKFIEEENIPLLAVRSSSPEEDLEGASFAGMYETVLGVNTSGLEEAIKVCFSSTFTEHVIMYKKSMGFDVKDPKIAVIIQKQIASDVSGVAFSLNPITNDYDECVINANFGLGTTVVDGTVSPDHILVNKITNQIIDKEVGKKDVAMYVVPDGGTKSKALSDPQKVSLVDAQIAEITALTTKVEEEFGNPMDIEWAYERSTLYLLQARPITGYIKLPSIMITKPGEQKKLYEDGLLTEQGLVESLSPLGIGVFGFVAGYDTEKSLSDYQDALVTMTAGRFYVNVGNLAKVIGKKQTLKTLRLVDSLGVQLLEQMDLNEYKPRGLPKGLLKSAIKLAMAQLSFKTIIRTRKASRKPDKYLKFFLEESAKLEENLKNIFENYHIENNFKDFCQNILINTVNKYMIKISLPTLFASMLKKSKIKKMFKKEAKSVQDQLVYLEQAFPNNVTIEMGMLLFELSQFSEIQKIGTEDIFIEMLNKEQFSTKFMENWKIFIDKYGFRGPREVDVATPRYYEKPGEIFSLLKSMGTYDNDSLTPRGIFEEGVKRREETVKNLKEILEKSNKSKVKSFKKAYKVLETFAAYREIHKYYIIIGIDYIRRAILTTARKWVSIGRLDTVEQIFYLNFGEYTLALNDQNLDIRSLVSENIAYRNQFKNNLIPPTLIDSRGRIPSLKREPTEENEFQGTPVSPGTVKGPIKILIHPDEKPVYPGDILVTRATDPGWTTLFLNAAGILIETGGTLQHGASVARELCKPCIVGLDNITSIMKDGQIVEFDGMTGIVKIVE